MKRRHKLNYRRRPGVDPVLPARLIRPVKKSGEFLFRVQELVGSQFVNVMETTDEDQATKKLAELFGYNIDNLKEVKLCRNE